MNDILPYVYYSLPWLFVIGLSIATVIGIAVGVVWPRWLVYPYLLVFFWINSTSYGSLAVFSSRSIYSRGSGVLFFGLVLWAMLGAWLCARVASGFGRHPAPACDLRPWFWGWTALLAGHVAVGFVKGVSLAASLAPSGFSNIVWMAPLISLLLLAFRTREQAIALAHFILLAGLGRALFGLGRWVVSGGDPNNVYANMNALQIRLTFFDINDSLLCTMAFAIAAVTLFQASPPALDKWWRGVCWLTLGATALCVVLSYRRTAWVGLLLACSVIVLRLPPRARLQWLAAGVPLVGATLAWVAVRRMDGASLAGTGAGARAEAGESGAGVGGLLSDMQSHRFGPESERVLELKLALADFLAHPLAGIGTWGRYHGYGAISWQNSPDGGLFLHSGLLHIALKSGLPGLILLAGTILTFVACARRALRVLPPALMGLGVAGVAGLAFMIPDLLVGTPFPQVRTTQMLALCLALPYVALACMHASALEPARRVAAPACPQPVPA